MNSKLLLYHCFPRSSQHRLGDEVAVGERIINSIFNIGMLLTHERIMYPLVTKTFVDRENGSYIDQVRCCFTLVDESELADHASIFGSFGLGFDVSVLRSIGAFPVIYIPQPVKSDTDGFVSPSIMGNNVVHQIRDIVVLIKELRLLESIAAKNMEIPGSILNLNFEDDSTRVTPHSLYLIIKYLLGKKGDFSYLLNALTFLVNIFYHADSARDDTWIMEEDLRYYIQKEWRLVSGLMIGRELIDRPLSRTEIRSLKTADPFFCKPLVGDENKALTQADTARAIRWPSGLTAFDVAEKIVVPDIISETNLARMFPDSRQRQKIYRISYNDVLARRAERLKSTA